MACCVLHAGAPGLSFSPVDQTQLFALEQHQRMLSMLSTGLQWSNGSQVRHPGKSKPSPALPCLPVRWSGNPQLAAYSRRTRVMWISRVIRRQRARGHSRYKQVRRDLSSSCLQHNASATEKHYRYSVYVDEQHVDSTLPVSALQAGSSATTSSRRSSCFLRWTWSSCTAACAKR